MITEIIIASVIAYLFGSISSAILVCKLMGLPDPRTQGSGNPGASNVLRIGGKKAAAVTLIGDVLKGFLPVLFVVWYGFDALGIAIVALAAVLGHLFPIFFRFEGGKGVATALGALLAVSWPSALLWMLTWLLVAVLFRYASVASICASLLMPVYVFFMTHNATLSIGFALISAILILSHAKNIRNLMAGTEAKLGKK